MNASPLSPAPLADPGPPPSPHRPGVLLVMDDLLDPTDVFDEQARDRIHRLARWDSPVLAYTAAQLPPRALAEAEVLLTCWGAPVLDGPFLDRAPRLRAVIHAAGSVKGIVTRATWQRGIAVSSAAWANALPVAEYTLAAVLSVNKQVLQIREHYRRTRSTAGLRQDWRHIGNYRRTIGIVGASHIGRRVIELLRSFDYQILLHDPTLDPAAAEALGTRLVPLDELCRLSDVVSLHAPALAETRGMINEQRLALMRDGATLINTARSDLVDGPALVAELKRGRLQAVIDVADPGTEAELYDLPNVFLTPHIAGSFGNELRRLGHAAVDELERFATGRPFQHGTTPQALDSSA